MKKLKYFLFVQLCLLLIAACFKWMGVMLIENMSWMAVTGILWFPWLGLFLILGVLAFIQSIKYEQKNKKEVPMR